MLTALFSVAYVALLTTSSIMRDRVQLTTCLSPHHGSVAIVAGADIALSPIDISDHPTV